MKMIIPPILPITPSPQKQHISIDDTRYCILSTTHTQLNSIARTAYTTLLFPHYLTNILDTRLIIRYYYCVNISMEGERDTCSICVGMIYKPVINELFSNTSGFLSIYSFIHSFLHFMQSIIHLFPSDPTPNYFLCRAQSFAN